MVQVLNRFHELTAQQQLAADRQLAFANFYLAAKAMIEDLETACGGDNMCVQDGAHLERIRRKIGKVDTLVSSLLVELDKRAAEECNDD